MPAHVLRADPVKFSVDDRLEQVGESARERMRPWFAKAGLEYPPQALLFVGLKEEKFLEVYATASREPVPSDAAAPNSDLPAYDWIPVCRYPILAASGGPGPKLREGDGQVPEGFYRIESLNPNSRFHLSLRLNYPNKEDHARAKEDGRKDPGSDIMIHGAAVSIGCLAMGDPAAEELFVLASDTGLNRISVLLAPNDLRAAEIPSTEEMPKWVPALYKRLSEAMKQLPVTEPSQE